MTTEPSRRSVLAMGSALAAFPLMGFFSSAAHAAGRAVTPPSGLGAAFTGAAKTYDVPRDLLIAVAYTLTHVHQHDGRPSRSGGYGVMHLTTNHAGNTIGLAAELSGLAADRLRTLGAASVEGGAALLRHLADAAGLTTADRAHLGAWYEPLGRYSGYQDPTVAQLEVDAVYDLLRHGASFDASGETFTITPRRRELGAHHTVATDGGSVAAASEDYPPARWIPADPSNYRVANRPSDYAIDRVVIHTMQGSYAGTISWFQNPSSNVSAHYVIRSSDGQVTQMVRNKNVAWHAGSTNNRSIGIEHEGWVDDPSWYTDAMYRSSAALTRHVCDRYGIPIDRSHIIGHSEAPGATHTDPGPHWDWPRYMSYVRGDGGEPSWSVIVDNSTPGAFTASENWAAASAPGQYGDNHRHAQPLLASDPAWYTAQIPTTASYRVEVWYPENPGNNSRAPYIVATTSGNQTVYVDQRDNGGRWIYIGTFALEQGKHPVVAVSRWTSSSGWIRADAVRISSLD